MKLYLFSTDDNSGTQFFPFFTKLERDGTFLKWCREHWFPQDGPLPECPHEAYRKICESGHCYAYVEDIDIADHPDVKAMCGAIGSLLHQVSQMRGMFGDEDGTIQDAVDAVDAGEAALEVAA